MYRVAIVALALALVGAACNKTETQVIESDYSDGIVHIAGRSVSVDIARTSDEQRQGLSGRSNLEENQGMVFFFQVPDFLEFWMKDMNFPIDIVWLKGDEVVDISTDVQSEPGVSDVNLRVYKPKKPADKVLELKAGWAERNGLKIGDKVEIISIVQ